MMRNPFVSNAVCRGMGVAKAAVPDSLHFRHGQGIRPLIGEVEGRHGQIERASPTTK